MSVSSTEESGVEQVADMMSVVTSKSNAFAKRYAFLLLGLVWFTLGSTLVSNLVVTKEPPRFPVCGPGRRLADGVACNPLVPLADPCDPSVPARYVEPAISVVSDFDLRPSKCAASGPNFWSSATTSFLRSLPFFGMAVSALLFVPLADKVGRKAIINLAALVFVVAQTFTALSPVVLFYAISYFVSACALTMLIIPTAVTAAELMPTGSRHHLALAQILGFSFGAAYAAYVAYFVGNWRTITFATLIPMLLFISGGLCVSRLFVESPKWLTCKGRMEEAYDVWQQIAAYNKVPESELLSLDDFIKYEVESSRAVVIKTPEDLDEELSLMSVQSLASPDSVIKACSSFPTSVWIAALLWLWVAASSGYSGVWHKRYTPMVQDLVDSHGITSLGQIFKWDFLPETIHDPVSHLQPAQPASRQMPPPPLLPQQPVLQPRPASPMLRRRILQMLPPQDSALQAPAQAAAQPAPAANPPSAGEPAQAPAQATQPTGANPPADVPPAQQFQNAKPLNITAAGEKPDKATESNYFKMLNAYLKDGSEFLISQAKQIPETAHAFYDRYELERMFDDIRRDFENFNQRSGTEEINKFNIKARAVLILTTMTYVLDLPFALLIILLSGRTWCGRKGACLLFSTAGGALLLASFVSTRTQTTMIAFSLAAAGRAFLAATYHMAYVYTAECVPTSVRCGSVGLLAGLGALFTAILIPFSDIIDGKLKDITLVFIGSIALIAGVLGATTLPDTLGLPLCDTLEVQDVMYENLGYHQKFMARPLHRMMAYVAHKCCCLRTFATTGSSFEARGRTWLRSKLKTSNRRGMYSTVDDSDDEENRQTSTQNNFKFAG